jgi:hypothetical protein
MLRTLWLTAAILFVFAASAQIDSVTIVGQIKTKGGYEKLLNRFIESDTTLTITDFKLIYYGFRYQAAYKPLESEFTENILKAYNKAGRYPDALAIADTVLTENPVSLRGYFEKAYTAEQSLDRTTEMYNMKRYIVLCNTIKNSGNGTLESPYVALSINDALEFMAYLRLPALDDRKLENGQIEFDLAKNKQKKIHLYFLIPDEAYIPPNNPVEDE